MLNSFFDTFRAKALNPHSSVCKFLKNIGVGRFAFRSRVLLLEIDHLLRRYRTRFIEYPWVLRKLGLGQGRLLLDVGCTGTLLDHELLARSFRVVGLDVQDHTLRNNREVFIQANVLNSGLPSQIFDIILVVSTLEHVGLATYEQDCLASDADIQAMKELRRLLKPNGVLLLTIPYEGTGPIRIHRWVEMGQERLERRYDRERLAKLLVGFKVVDSNFFLCLLKHQCKFLPVEKSTLDKLSAQTCEGSLACLVLRRDKA